MASADSDKRRDKRLDLTLPVKFSRKPEDTLTPFEGVTHNVSSGGVYFEAPVGKMTETDTLWVRIGVPAHHGDDSQNLTLSGAGTIRRVEPLRDERVRGDWPIGLAAQGIYGIAVQFQQRPTIKLRSFEQLLWDDHHAD